MESLTEVWPHHWVRLTKVKEPTFVDTAGGVAIVATTTPVVTASASASVCASDDDDDYNDDTSMALLFDVFVVAVCC
ncbi:hypothetical protein ACROYT_G024729 [Oculina patagonica]